MLNLHLLMDHKKIWIVLLILAIALFVTGYCLLLISKSREFQFFGEIIARVNTTQKVVALTFDDAPSANADKVLQILSENNVKATFYVIGQQAEQFPELLRSIADQGHELGNHSYSHERFLFVDTSFVENEIKQTDGLIRDAGYAGEITFRPPNGKKLFVLPWYLWQNNIKTIMWDVEPDTYYPGDIEQITRYTIESVRPGSIILMHPMCDIDCSADRDALSAIIRGLAEKGYEFVTINQLLSYK